MTTPMLSEVATSLPDEIVAAMDATYGMDKVSIDRAPTLFSARTVGGEQARVSRIGVDGAMRMLTAPVDGVFIVQVRRGVYRARVGGQERAHHRGDLFALPPGTELRAATEDLGEDVLYLSPERAGAIAQDLTGVPLRPGAFEALTSVGPNRTRRLAPLWAQIVEVMTRSDLAGSPLLFDSTYRTLVGSLLEALGVLGVPPSGRAHDRVTDRAIEAMRERVAEPVSVGDLARETGVSVRTLQVAFRARYDTSPLAYLRSLRLDAARDDLLRADPGETHVRDIAYRWGFAHLGRFAADYARAYGERPHDTLQR